jgi:P-type Cu+ transporter
VQCDLGRGIAVDVADALVLVGAVVALVALGWFFFGPRRARAAELADGVQRVAVTVRAATARR